MHIHEQQEQTALADLVNAESLRTIHLNQYTEPGAIELIVDSTPIS